MTLTQLQVEFGQEVLPGREERLLAETPCTISIPGSLPVDCMTTILPPGARQRARGASTFPTLARGDSLALKGCAATTRSYW